MAQPRRATQPENRAMMMETPSNSKAAFNLEEYEAGPVVETRNPLGAADVTEGPLNLDAEPPGNQEPPAQSGATEQPAVPSTTEPKWQADPRFKGKTADDLYNSLVNQEEVLGRQGNELGMYRKRFDEMVLAPKTTEPSKPQVATDPNLLNRLLENPEAVLKEVEERATKRVFTQFSQAASETAMQAKVNEVNDIVKDPAFIPWLKENVPFSVVQQADKDPQALGYIVNQFNNSRTPQPKVIKQEAERRIPVGTAVGVPQGAGGARVTPVSFTRVQLMKMQDDNPREYEARQDEIIEAYRQGRVK